MSSSFGMLSADLEAALGWLGELSTVSFCRVQSHIIVKYDSLKKAVR